MRKTFGCLLEIIGMVVVFVVLLGGLASTPIKSALSPLICGNTQLEITSSDAGDGSYSVSMACIDATGNRHSANLQIYILIVVAGVIPIIIGNWLIRRRKRNAFPMPDSY